VVGFGSAKGQNSCKPFTSLNQHSYSQTEAGRPLYITSSDEAKNPLTTCNQIFSNLEGITGVAPPPILVFNLRSGQSAITDCDFLSSVRNKPSRQGNNGRGQT